ncbi:hypothetical protein V6Z11_D01G017600 [Gossypium hirsutum]
MGNIFSIALSLDTIITRCGDCAAGQASFICNLEDNLHALDAEVAKLKELRGDLMSRVRIAEDEQQHKRLNQVEGWLQRADHVIADADQLSGRVLSKLKSHVWEVVVPGIPGPPTSSGSKSQQYSKSHHFLPQTKRPSEPTVGLESYVNQVWSSLQKEQVGVIGIYALGGVGKTTLLNQINNKFHDTTHDYRVTWAVASQDRPIEKVQDQIAKRIGLSNEGWESRSRDEKAGDIFNVLCRKKFAVLLDDIWERFDLTGAGVPLPTQQNGSKVIFTTRSRDVCLECLPPGKALKLFEEKVGSETLQMHPDIRKLATAVVEEQSAASVFPGVGKEMYPKLKFSYDSLTSERVKSCFLYCSFLPEDHPIQRDELIHCWIGEGFMDEHTDLSTARNQGRFIIGSLIDACLLEKVRFSDRVRMHDVVRDMALWILKELPEAEKWEEITGMSLMDNQIENLTEILECPNLQTLFLSNNDLKVIMDDFFNSMPMLRVLDLPDNTNLKLPVELKALEKLKYLNLEWTRDLEMIPQQLISSFSKLRVLKMMRCGYGCSLLLELKNLNVLTLTFRSASEVEKASRFNKLFSCAIEHVSLLHFRDSRPLNILALVNLQNLYSIKCTNCMDLKEVKIESNIVEGARYFHSLWYVGLTYCKQMRDVSWVIFAPHLEKLLIRGFHSFKEIISEEKLDEVTDSKANTNLFSRLEELDLCRLPKMKTISYHALPFPQLKKISIVKCPMLKKLPLNSNSAKGQRLIIKGEKGWWKDVEWEDESTRTAFLPSFKPQ